MRQRRCVFCLKVCMGQHLQRKHISSVRAIAGQWKAAAQLAKHARHECGCREKKEAKKAETAAAEARAVAETELAATTSSSEAAAAQAEQARQEAARAAEELRDYKVVAWPLMYSMIALSFIP